MQKIIACFGSGQGNDGGEQYERMREVGRLLTRAGFEIATGGYGGSGMEAPARGAREQGAVRTTGYTLKCRSKEPNPWLTNVITCGVDVRARVLGTECFVNNDAMEYCLRLGLLLQASGFVVDPTDPTPGTLIEFLAVVNLNEKFWATLPRPIVVVTGLKEALRFMHGIRDLPVRPFVRITLDPKEAVEWLIHKLI